MGTRKGTVKFFKISSRQDNKIIQLINKISEIHGDFENRNFEEIPNVVLEDDTDNETQEILYIQAMEKRRIEFMDNDNYFYWLMTISKVNIGEEIDIANIERNIDDRRRSIDHGDNEGVVKDAWMIFDPFRSIVAMYAIRGTITTPEVKKFMNRLIDVTGIMFKVILNEDGYRRIDQLDEVNKLTYKIASPDKFSNFSDESRTEKADLKFAERMRTEELEIILTANDFTKNRIKQKITNLFSETGVEIKKMKVDGVNDGVDDPIDLLKNKLIYKGTIEFEDELDDPAVYGFLNTAYDKHSNYLRTTYAIQANEGENF